MELEKSMLNKIKSKARWASCKYGMPYEDLVQDGAVLACSLLGKHNSVNEQYIIGAVKKLFLNKARAKRIRGRYITPQGVDNFSSTAAYDMIPIIDESLDREKFVERLSNPILKSLLRKLIEGYSIEQIAREHRISTRTVYRHIDKLRHLRIKLMGG